MKDRFEPLPVINPSAAVLAVFGSPEGYLNSPALKEVQLRIVYLKTLKKEINERIAEERKSHEWWNLIRHLRGYVVVTFFLPNLNNRLDSFIKKYETMRGLPIPFFVRETGIDCDEFLSNFKKLIMKTDVGKYDNVF